MGIDIKKLKELSEEINQSEQNLYEKIERLQNMRIPAKRTKNKINYMVDGGECRGNNILNKPEISIQDAVMQAGTKFPKHLHTEKEFLIQYSGKAKVVIYQDDETTEFELNIGDCAEIPAGISHEYEAITDVKLIGVAIPACCEYPK